MSPHKRWRPVIRQAGILAVLLVHTSNLSAATSVDLTITLTIDHEVSIAWSNNDGSTIQTSAESWAIGSVSLDSLYVSTSDGTGPTLRYLSNESRTGLVQDVDISVSSSTDGWTIGASRGTDQFTVEVATDGSTWTHLDSGADDYIANLAAGAQMAADLEFRLGTPNALTTGVGSAQTITITFTAEDGTSD